MDAGDCLLICSDGLYSVLSDEQIAEILAKYEGEIGGGAWLRGTGDQASASDDHDTEGTVTEATVAEGTVAQAEAPGGVCDALVHAANLAGGPDNITVILVRL